MPVAVLFDYGHTLAEFDASTPELRACALGGVAAHLAARAWTGAAAPDFADRLDRALQERMGPVQERGGDMPFGRVLAEVLPGTDPQALERAMRRATLTRTRLADGAAEVLHALRAAGARLAIVSDASFFAATTRWELHELGIGDLFDAVVTSGDVGRFKPDLRMFTAALEALGASPDRAWHVGDWWDGDVQGARTAGIRPVWRRRDPGQAPPDPAVPTIDDLTQLVPLVLGGPPTIE